MSTEYLFDDYREVLRSLLSHCNSFIVQYPEPRPNNMPRWFFVESPESELSQVIPDKIGKYLVDEGRVYPELSDEEYQIQLALGSINYRVYKIGPAAQKETGK